MRAFWSAQREVEVVENDQDHDDVLRSRSGSPRRGVRMDSTGLLPRRWVFYTPDGKSVFRRDESWEYLWKRMNFSS